MNKKLPAYASIIIILIIAILSVSVFLVAFYSIQNTLLVSSMEDGIQATYIAESYRDHFVDRLIENQDKDSIRSSRLFPTMDYSLDYSYKETNFSNSSKKATWPEGKILSAAIYKDIEARSVGILHKYNRILTSNLSPVSKNNIDPGLQEDFTILADKIHLDSSIKANVIENSYIDQDYSGLRAYDINFYDLEEGGPSNIYNINEPYYLTGVNFIGLPNSMRNIYLSGIIYSDAHIKLNSNFVFKGIFISNNGSLDTGAYSSKIEGIFIELGDRGSYPMVDFDYKAHHVHTFCNDKDWAINYKLKKRFNEII